MYQIGHKKSVGDMNNLKNITERKGSRVFRCRQVCRKKKKS